MKYTGLLKRVSPQKQKERLLTFNSLGSQGCRTQGINARGFGPGFLPNSGKVLWTGGGSVCGRGSQRESGDAWGMGARV